MLHWYADIAFKCSRMLPAPQYSVHFLLKRYSSTFTDWQVQTTSGTFLLNNYQWIKCGWMLWTCQGPTQHFNISHTWKTNILTAVEKAWGQCWCNCIHTPHTCISEKCSYMQIQGCWVKHRPAFFQEIKRRSGTVKSVLRNAAAPSLPAMLKHFVFLNTTLFLSHRLQKKQQISAF